MPPLPARMHALLSFRDQACSDYLAPNAEKKVAGVTSWSKSRHEESFGRPFTEHTGKLAVTDVPIKAKALLSAANSAARCCEPPARSALVFLLQSHDEGETPHFQLGARIFHLSPVSPPATPQQHQPDP
eukprot:1161389-Pelagomonas_calceolata.AAC.2